MSCIIAIYYSHMWKHNNTKYGSRMREYINKYQFFLFAFTMFGSFYSTIDLLKSKLFYLYLFNIPLKHNELNSLKILRFANIALLEV